MHSHSSAYQPVTGTDAYSHPLPGQLRKPVDMDISEQNIFLQVF